MVSFHRSALSRQVKEAVRIRRRGGANQILNSKGEFNRSHIPRLTLENTEEQKKRAGATREQLKTSSKELDTWYESWEQAKTTAREQERADISSKLGRLSATESQKRELGAAKTGRPKRLRYALLEMNWGEGEPAELIGGTKTTGNNPPALPDVQEHPLDILEVPNLPGRSPTHLRGSRS